MSPIHQEGINSQEGNILHKEKAIRQVIQETAFRRNTPISQIPLVLIRESPHVWECVEPPPFPARLGRRLWQWQEPPFYQRRWG